MIVIAFLHFKKALSVNKKRILLTNNTIAKLLRKKYTILLNRRQFILPKQKRLTVSFYRPLKFTILIISLVLIANDCPLLLNRY